jgi:hypothetical protein
VVAVEAALITELESLRRSYDRLSRDVGGRINFACDLDNDDALKVAEQEKVHLDHAFFVLSFAALEVQVTSLACARSEREDRKAAMRGRKFEDRWDAAAKVAEETLKLAVPWARTRAEVLSWYNIRSDIAHGRPPTQLADVPSVLYRADEIATTLRKVASALGAE